MPSYEYEFYVCPKCKTRLTTKKCSACGVKTKGQGKVSARYRLVEESHEKQKRTGWYQTKKEAESEYMKVVASTPITNYQLKKGESFLFEDMLKRHLLQNSLETHSSTQYDKRNIIDKYILPKFKGVEVNKIKKEQLIDWQTWLFSQKYKRGKNGAEKKLSNRYAKKIRGILNTFLNWAQEIYDIPNKFHGTKAPKGSMKVSKKDILEVSEFDILDKVSIDNIFWNTFFYFYFHTGMRPGEGRAFPEYNYSQGNVTIDRTISLDEDGKPKIDDTKNDKEYTKPIADVLIRKLDRYISWKRANNISDTFLFGGDKYISKNMLARELEKYMQKTKIKKHITPHCFRHSYVSMLIDMGCSTKMIAEMIGDTEEMVIKTYSQLYSAKKRQTIDMLNEYLAPKKTVKKYYVPKMFLKNKRHNILCQKTF